MAEYKKIQRSKDGVGGIRCNCCRIGTVKQHKALSNRLVRRYMSMNPQDIRNAHEEAEMEDWQEVVIDIGAIWDQAEADAARDEYWSFIDEIGYLEYFQWSESNSRTPLINLFWDHTDAMGHDHFDDAGRVIGKVKEGSAQYWRARYAQAVDRAAYQLENKGFSINNLLGRVVF